MKLVVKTCVLIIFIIGFKTSLFALGGFSSLSTPEQKTINIIVKQLGISNPSNEVKYKIYKSISFAFNSSWSNYWLGLNELSASKYEKGKEKGLIDYVFNNKDNGTLFFTFVYKPEVNQVVVFKRQIRHGEKSVILDLFEKRKSDTEVFEIRHDKDNYAMLQKKGIVSYQLYHVGASTASLTYYSQSIIDLN